MTSTPWMKFYPSDWRADPALRMCGLAARGLWMEMLAIMHESSPRGLLLINGRQVDNRQLSALVGVDIGTVETLLSELELAGVFSRKKNGVIFSRRMERDENRARKNRENGKKGGNPSLSNPTIIHESDNHRDNTQKPEARSQKPEATEKIGAASPQPHYAFVGRTVRLKPQDYDRWRKAYHAIPDYEAELTKADDYYTDNPPPDGKWFFPVSKWLEKAHRDNFQAQSEYDAIYRGAHYMG